MRGISQLQRRPWLPLIAFLGAAVLAFPAGVARAADEPARVAVVNVARVMDQMQERKDVQDKFKQDQDATAAEDKRKQEDLLRMRDALEQLKADSPEMKAAQEKLLRASMEYKIWAELQNAEFERRHKEELVRLFDKIKDACGAAAQKHNVDIVVSDTTETPAAVDKMTPDQLSMFLGSRGLLYRSSKVDMTEDVINLLNANYVKPATAPPAGGMAPPIEHH